MPSFRYDVEYYRSLERKRHESLESTLFWVGLIGVALIVLIPNVLMPAIGYDAWKLTDKQTGFCMLVFIISIFIVAGRVEILYKDQDKW
jgi:hypothetical protein